MEYVNKVEHHVNDYVKTLVQSMDRAARWVENFT